MGQRDNTPRRDRGNRPIGRSHTTSDRPRLTEEKKDELRANNQCFICEQKGHLSRDCPKRKVIRPPGIRSAVIDHLSSLVHLLPSRATYGTKEVAEMIFDSVYKHHGTPEIIVSDRDSLFTSGFWEHLHKLTNTELRMSTAYHPQTDGATERANRTITQMLRLSVNSDQRDWVLKLPGIEFGFNSAISSVTGFSPFYLNYGTNPSPMIWSSSSDIIPGVRSFMSKLRDGLLAAHDAILTQRVKQTFHANKRRQVSPFALGDLVYLSTENLSIPKGQARKLFPKFIGPFRITKEISLGTTYQLQLPAELRSRGIHPNFHASLLRIHVPNDDRRFPGRAVPQVTGLGAPADEFLVDKIVSHFGHGSHLWFELLWQSGDRTWLRHGSIRHLSALEVYLENLNCHSIFDLPIGSGKPPQSIRDQVESPELIDMQRKNHDRHDHRVQSNALWIPHRARYLKPEFTRRINTQFNKTPLHFNTTYPRNMAIFETEAATESYFQYLYQLTETAMHNSPHPGTAPPGFEAWATTHGKPRDVQEARNRIPRTTATYTDPNGDIQWLGQHAIPGTPSYPPPGLLHGHQHPYTFHAPPAGPLMSTQDHLDLMRKYREFDRSSTRDVGNEQIRPYRGGMRHRNKSWSNRSTNKPYSRRGPPDNRAEPIKGHPDDIHQTVRDQDKRIRDLESALTEARQAIGGSSNTMSSGLPSGKRPMHPTNFDEFTDTIARIYRHICQGHSPDATDTRSSAADKHGCGTHGHHIYGGHHSNKQPRRGHDGGSLSRHHDRGCPPRAPFQPQLNQRF
jgi:Zinc knuckle